MNPYDEFKKLELSMKPAEAGTQIRELQKHWDDMVERIYTLEMELKKMKALYELLHGHVEKEAEKKEDPKQFSGYATKTPNLKCSHSTLAEKQPVVVEKTLAEKFREINDYLLNKCKGVAAVVADPDVLAKIASSHYAQEIEKARYEGYSHGYSTAHNHRNKAFEEGYEQATSELKERFENAMKLFIPSTADKLRREIFGEDGK